MNYSNLKHADDRVGFALAVRRGLGRGGGLYFPDAIQAVDDLPHLLAQPFADRSAELLSPFVSPDLARERLGEIVREAFDFPVEQVRVSDNVHALELFHGPSLAFKDFGARFMAGCLEALGDGGPTTILTATSGDTGAAVAHAFHGKAAIRAVILYPRGRITRLQEKLFCTLGGNIHTIAVDADFDACQALVKRAFDDEALRAELGLNSANSINVARLLAQVCYYFESVARLDGEAPRFSVPSGNFGNVTACLLARALGLPTRGVVAATNVNDTVPRYLEDGRWDPRATVATLSNAMDISRPNNFPRVEELARRAGRPLGELIDSVAVSDAETTGAMGDLHAQGYVADPHSALAWLALSRMLRKGDTGVFLCTAHPAKFAEIVDDALGIEVELPPALAEVQDKKVLSAVIPNEFEALKEELLG